MNASHGCPRIMHADHPNGMLRKRIGLSERCKLWVPSPEETAEFSSRAYEMAPQVYDRMIQTLGAEAPETDVFASRDAPLLRKCRRH